MCSSDLERGSSDAAEDYAGRRKLLVDEKLLEHPRLWLADARWARINGLDHQAARCLWEAIRREPDLRAANYQLAQVLLRLGRPNDARRFRERARQLGAFERTLGLIETRLNLESDWSDLGLLRKAAEQCERMGRLWEAFGWASDKLFRYIGIDEDYRAAGHTFFTVETHLNYAQEASLGAPFRVTTRVLGVDAKRLHLFHAMYRVDEGGVTGELLCTTEQMLLHVDTDAGSTAPMLDGPAAALAAIADAQADLPVPPQVGRVMQIPG